MTALYPAVVPPYRTLGYELAGSFCEHRLALDAIPAAAGRSACRRARRPRTGRGGPSGRLPGRGSAPTPARSSRRRRDAGATRSCRPSDETFTRGRGPRGRADRPGVRRVPRRAPSPGTSTSTSAWSARAVRRHAVAALRALLAYFRGFRGVGIWVQWSGPPHPTPIALAHTDQDIERPFRFDWMFRLLDVAAALRRRGYPADRRRRRRRGRRPDGSRRTPGPGGWSCAAGGGQ